jgi:hypothetical protein
VGEQQPGAEGDEARRGVVGGAVEQDQVAEELLAAVRAVLPHDHEEAVGEGLEGVDDCLAAGHHRGALPGRDERFERRATVVIELRYVFSDKTGATRR